MSTAGIDYAGTATVSSVSPLKVKMPKASTGQPAVSHWSGTLTVGQSVIVLVLAGGATYVQGPA